MGDYQRTDLCREREAHAWTKTHLKVMQNFAGKVAERVECIRPHADTFGIQLGQCLTEAIPSVVEEWLKERERVQDLWTELHGITDGLGAGLPNLDPDSGCTPGDLVLGLKRENQKLRRIAARWVNIATGMGPISSHIQVSEELVDRRPCNE